MLFCLSGPELANVVANVVWQQIWMVMVDLIPFMFCSRLNSLHALSILTAIFQVNVGEPVLLELWMKEMVVTTGSIRRAKLQSNSHHQ